jgi:hypothetical protein
VSDEPQGAQWFADPTGRNDKRWWDGEDWTDHVLSADGKEWTELFDDRLGAAVLIRHLGPSEPAAPDRFFDGAFTAGPPSGKPSPPAVLTADIPLLPAALGADQPALPWTEEPALPAVRDWSWRAGEPKSPVGIASNIGKWDEIDAEMLTEALEVAFEVGHG